MPSTSRRIGILVGLRGGVSEMKNNVNDGGPAYPRTQWTGSQMNSSHRDVPGMSLRDWFAGQAMIAIMSQKETGEPVLFSNLALESYSISDAMLKERNK